jgi:hypothetical protein
MAVRRELLEDADPTARRGLLRGGVTAPTSGPAFAGLVAGALFHDPQLRLALREGIGRLGDLRVATPSVSRTHLDSLEMDSWSERALRAQGAAAAMVVMEAVDTWLAWPCSAQATTTMATAVLNARAAGALAAAGAPLSETSRSFVSDPSSALATHGGFATGMLAAVMSELQFALRETTMLKGLSKLNANLPEQIGTDVVFKQYAGRRRVSKQCCNCGTTHTAFEPFLSLPLQPPSAIRKLELHGPEAFAPGIPMGRAVDAAMYRTVLQRNDCRVCGLRAEEHRCEEGPGEWPAHGLVLVPPSVVMHAGDCIKVLPVLTLPERLTDVTVRFALMASVVQHQWSGAACVTYLNAGKQPCASADGRLATAWKRASPLDGVSDVSEEEVMGESSVAARLLVYRRLLPAEDALPFEAAVASRREDPVSEFVVSAVH